MDGGEARRDNIVSEARIAAAEDRFHLLLLSVHYSSKVLCHENWIYGVACFTLIKTISSMLGSSRVPSDVTSLAGLWPDMISLLNTAVRAAAAVAELRKGQRAPSSAKVMCAFPERPLVSSPCAQWVFVNKNHVFHWYCRILLFFVIFLRKIYKNWSCLSPWSRAIHINERPLPTNCFYQTCEMKQSKHWFLFRDFGLLQEELP